MARGLRSGRAWFCGDFAQVQFTPRTERAQRHRRRSIESSRSRARRRSVGAHDLGWPPPRDPERVGRQFASTRRSHAHAGAQRLRRFPGGAERGHRSRAHSVHMQTQRATTPSRQSPELRRRLRARARRTKVLRRRIVALTIGLFLALWGAIGAAGYLGVYKTAQVSLLASTASSRSTGTTRRAAAHSSAGTDATSSGSSEGNSAPSTSTTTTTTTATPTAVTTSQS